MLRTLIAFGAASTAALSTGAPLALRRTAPSRTSAFAVSRFSVRMMCDAPAVAEAEKEAEVSEPTPFDLLDVCLLYTSDAADE